MGVLAIRTEKALVGEQRSFLDALARQVGLALDRVHLAEEARVAALRARTEELRSGLLSSVSHNLRTPLAAITGAATALRDGPLLRPTRTRSSSPPSWTRQSGSNGWSQTSST